MVKRLTAALFVADLIPARNFLCGLKDIKIFTCGSFGVWLLVCEFKYFVNAPMIPRGVNSSVGRYLKDPAVSRVPLSLFL